MEFLFERLSRSPLRGDARLREAVRKQLEWLVGSREWRAEEEGTALIEAAMPEPPSLGATEADIRRYALRLRRLIERWEPRLLGARVELIPTGRPLSPFRVVVTGRLDSGHPDDLVRFEHEAEAR